MFFRKVQRGRHFKDKWNIFVASLFEGERTGEYIPYLVEVKKIDGKLYAFVGFKEEFPKVTITKKKWCHRYRY